MTDWDSPYGLPEDEFRLIPVFERLPNGFKSYSGGSDMGELRDSKYRVENEILMVE